MTEPDDFGCDYCRDDQNRLYGHVTQIGSDERRQTVLLRCPRCGALYENTSSGPDATRRVEEAEAHDRYPNNRLDAAFALVRGVLNAHDPEHLLTMGAPVNEYDAEVGDLVQFVLGSDLPTAVAVLAVWTRWFGPTNGMSNELATAVSDELRVIRHRFPAA